MLKIAYHPCYSHPLPENHRFPMLKYELLPEQLIYEGTVTSKNFFTPTPVATDLIKQVHTHAYWERLRKLEITPKEQRVSGFPHSKQLINREITIMGGTVQCAQSALEHGIAMNVAGGTHHAFTDRGEGFCLLNDMALAAQWLLNEKRAKRILFVDLDVHQGNGSAQIFTNNASIFTLSMHGEHNYPLRKEQSSLDIPLADGCNDKEYLRLLDQHLKRTLDDFQPDFIFYQSGVDILASDKLGRLGVSREGCRKRDKMVIGLAHLHGIPLVASMGGGYSEDIKVIVDAHANTFRLAQEIFF